MDLDFIIELNYLRELRCDGDQVVDDGRIVLGTFL